MAQRDTPRKKLIRRVVHERFGGGPVLLSELRWRVLEAQAEEAGEAIKSTTRSNHESVNQTIRIMKDELTRYRIGPVNNIPLGVAAREACMRLERLATIDRLVHDTEVIAALRWVGTATATGALQAPEFSFWTGDPSDGTSLRCHGVVRLNNGRPVTFVSTRKPSKKMVREMGHSEWRTAVVRRWPEYLLGSPRKRLERIYAEGGRSPWTTKHPFGSRRQAYGLALRDAATPFVPLSGRLPTKHQGVPVWGTLYKLVRAD